MPHFQKSGCSIPTHSGEDGPDGIVAAMQEGRHIVADILHPFMIICPAGSKNIVADRLAINGALVKT
jgi:hypothetical protein